jgi:membrane protease subunit HflK
MSGRYNSPWGGRQGDRRAGKAGDAGRIPAAGFRQRSRPVAKPRGPRNPWLPPGKRRGRAALGRASRISSAPAARKRAAAALAAAARPAGAPDGKSWWPLGRWRVRLRGWLVTTSIHFIGPKEQGMVTTMGRYSRTSPTPASR